MLRLLRIRNLAVIEAVQVEFEPGFNVLTGETGAGKSIVVEAVGLLLGARASADLVRTGETQASIEALFEDESGREYIMRREITNQGRSRSYIDGALATAGALRELSLHLVELHGQHEHQALLDPATHLPLLDSLAALQPLCSEVGERWRAVQSLQEAVDRSRMDARERGARLDLVLFQLAEIDKVAPQSGEDEALATTKQVLASAERIRRLCDESYNALYESDVAVLAALSGVWKRVGELAGLDSRFAPYVEARDGIKSQLEDLALFLRSYADGVDPSPARLQHVEDRLAAFDRLKRKYGPTLDDVLERRLALSHERDLLSGGGQAGEALTAQLESAAERYLEVARDLSRRRRAVAVQLSTSIERLLAQLAMERTRFEVRFNDEELSRDGWSERGIDQAEFFVSPNPGEDLRPLARIVSGGELSRVMLAMKTLAARAGVDAAAARNGAGRTLIFDEVDAGIGGRVADVLGTQLQGLATEFQILCITHLPQIAARATAHFRIDKAVRGARTVTSVERLGPEERVEEIARMLGGATVGPPIRATARELLRAGSGAALSSSTAPEGRPNRGAKVKAKAKGESESP